MVFRIFLGLALSLGFVGCAYRASFNPSPYVNSSALEQHRSTRSPAEVVFLKSVPDQPFVVLGTIDAPNVEWTAHYNTEDLINAMRKKAAAIGADAILDFRTQHNPTIAVTGHISPYYGGYLIATPYKGLHAWGEAILFVTPEEKARIEPQ